LIGSPAPDFTVQDSARTVALHELRGKPVVLNFWATYCAPCVEEMPSLVQMQRSMNGRLTVLAVSLDENEDQYVRFLRNNNIDLLTVRDPAGTKSSRFYGTTGYPETFIIDGNGTVRRKFIGPVNWTNPEVIGYLSDLTDTRQKL